MAVFSIGMFMILSVFFLASSGFFELLFDRLGVDLRIINKLLSGEFFDFSNRTYIYELSGEIIKENGIKISGFFADRYYLRNYAEYHDWIAYAHNLILESLIDFGWILGSAMIIALTVLLIRCALRSSQEKKIVLLIISVLVLFRLFVSSSFMIEGLFYTLLGILFSKKEIVKGNSV